MTMRKTTVVAMVLSVGIATAYFGSPYWVVYQIGNAVAAGQGDRVATYIDFPALRESLKTQFVLATTKQMESKGKVNASATLAQAFALSIMDGLVDAMVSPEGVAIMIRSGKEARPTLEVKAAPTSASTAERREPQMPRGYEGLDTFHTALVDPETNDMLTAVLSRQGFVTWKLTAVRIPGVINP